jgi:hypothetical protein
LRRLAELLAHLQAWPLLKDLVSRAREIDDPDARELAEDFASEYAPCWSATPGSDLKATPMEVVYEKATSRSIVI